MLYWHCHMPFQHFSLDSRIRLRDATTLRREARMRQRPSTATVPFGGIEVLATGLLLLMLLSALLP